MTYDWLNSAPSAATLHALQQANPPGDLGITVLAPLSHWGLIEFVGDDSQLFLQGQLSNDVRQLTPAQAQRSTYSTAKGRMLASLLLWPSAEGYIAAVSTDIREAIQKRLSMYILRAKVKPRQPELCLFGLAGPQAAALLQRQFGQAPSAALELHTSEQGVQIIAVPHLGYLLAVPAAQAAELWQTLAQEAAPVLAEHWAWLEVRAGAVRVEAATQEAFVPQMANMEQLGAISFNKGCYTGQEVVARAHYLGKVKRQAILAHIASDTAHAGDAVFSSTSPEQAIGEIANVARHPAGGLDVLAVVQNAGLEGSLHLGSGNGPELVRLPLPYPLEA